MDRRKKIVFVNNNMKIGGVQKALVEVLWAVHQDYDVTLLLFCKSGALLDQIPEDVRVVKTSSHYKYLGIGQKECCGWWAYLTRAFYVVIARTLGISWVTRLMNLTVKRQKREAYDCAISFLHCAREKNLYGGVAEYTLSNVLARKKACYIHCDYLQSGTYSAHSQKIYRCYDQIVCVSDSVRKRFLEMLPELSSQTVAIRNPLDEEKVRQQAKKNPYTYTPGQLNVLTVARLSAEKGIGRILKTMLSIDGFHYYVVGSGSLRSSLDQSIRDNGLEQRVFLLGEDPNPYRYMAGADLLAVPSYHEAAPVVFQEAAALGLPVLATRTLSAEEMIPEDGGLVTENTDEAIADALRELAADPDRVAAWKQNRRPQVDGRAVFRKEFRDLIVQDER